jgi:NADP-dependent 3-hydroxy acid dehydrogenase YdfG
MRERLPQGSAHTSDAQICPGVCDGSQFSRTTPRRAACDAGSCTRDAASPGSTSTRRAAAAQPRGRWFAGAAVSHGGYGSVRTRHGIQHGRCGSASSITRSMATTWGAVVLIVLLCCMAPGTACLGLPSTCMQAVPHDHDWQQPHGAFVVPRAGTPAPSWAAAAAGAALGGVFAALHRYGSARLWRPPHGSLNVVITGGTRGLGKALAREFLTHADSVLITGRSAADAAASAAQLAEELVGLGHPRPRLGDAPAGGAGPALHVMACDVTSPEDVAALGKAAVALLGSVDVWVCNAGTAGSFKSFLDADDDTLGAVVRTNLLGALLCAREAGRCMLHQPLGGHIFLMDGAGADGGPTPQYAAYGAHVP